MSAPNSREIEEIVEHFAVEWVNRNLDANTQARTEFVKEFLHQELQKAREEERERIFDAIEQLPCHKHGGVLPDGKIPAAILVSDIQRLFQSELDQITSTPDGGK